MKDFYDIWVLARSNEFALPRAIRATFDRRGTQIPAVRPDALTAAFAADAMKQQQWTSFVENIVVQPGTLAEVIQDIAAFLMPRAEAAREL
jgi:Nucleotidyl transferase AbiEii toxin, Type IV TA system